jgi:HEAT repeat protein
MTRRPKTMRDVLQGSDTANLLWGLETTEPTMQARICLELSRRGAKEAVGPLRKHLYSRDQKVCEAAAEALGQIGDQSAGEDLLRLFSDTKQPETLRDTCAFSLARLAYEPATWELVKALADPSPTVRICVLDALAAIRNPDTRQHVQYALVIEQNPRVRAAMEAMLKLVPARQSSLYETIDVSSHSCQSFAFPIAERTGFVFSEAEPQEHPITGSQPDIFESEVAPFDFSLSPAQPPRQSQTWQVNDD